jgi:hypothetical protein
MSKFTVRLSSGCNKKSGTGAASYSSGTDAHASSPMMGQGGCMAMEDAYVLAEVLRSAAAVESALDAYVTRRGPRVKWVQQEGRAVSESIRLSPEIRNATLRARGDVRASVPPPHGDAVAEGTELRSQQEARRVGGGPATMTAPRARSLRPQSQNREITSLHLPSAAAFGTSRPVNSGFQQSAKGWRADIAQPCSSPLDSSTRVASSQRTEDAEPPRHHR